MRSSVASWTVFLAILLSAFVFLSAWPANGQPTDQTTEPPITYLEKGDPAPFSGDLFPPEKSARLGLRIEHCQQMAAADIAKATRIFEVELKAEKDKLKAMLETERMHREVLERRIDELSAWYRSPEFVAIVAVGGAVALIIGTAALADAVLNRG